MEALEEKPRAPVATRRIAVGSAVLVAGILALAAVHKPATPAVASTAEAAVSGLPAANAVGAGAGATTAATPPASTVAPLPQSASNLAPTPGLAQVPPEETPSQPSSDDSHARRKPLHVTPFGSGAVGHANVLHLRMDGMIEKIEGATTPTGFNIVIPDRRSLEAAAPLAARDSRIAAIRITNEANGAELAISFKDGVPNYLVRAKGDSLEILLAPQGKLADAESTTVTRKRHLPRR